MNQLLVKTYIAGAAVSHGRFVKIGSADDTVIHAAAAGDGILGVTDCPGGADTGERVDVVLLGFTELEAGGTISRGTLVTSDSVGRAVAAAPASGANASTGGRTTAAAASGDRMFHFFVPGQIQGA